ncbi:MAG: hypothetical protein FJ253_10095, partial [Phycisphaerae bacterium]|nr:hypothetical protein [Phycisphaerae bacterium]
ARSELLGRARSLLEASDSPLADALDLLGEAKALAGGDSVLSASPADRQTIANQIDQLVRRLVGAGNAQFDGVALFGGTRSGSPPWIERGVGVLYEGRGAGLDLGLGEASTISGHQAFGGVSRRIDLAGTVNLALGYETPITAWGAGPLGEIMVLVDGQSQIVNLSGTVTLRDLKDSLENLDLGIRVEFDAASGKAWVRNELSGVHLSISDRPGDDTASRLGIDTFATYTLLSDFNDERGVRFAQPGVDPITGSPAAQTGDDLVVTLRDGRSFVVDFANETTVQAVMNTMHAAATAAGIVVPGEFEVTLRTDGNGFIVNDGTVGAGVLSIAPVNGSWAAEDLGFIGGTLVLGSTLIGVDRAQVAVDGAFTHLLALRDAILAADGVGMKIALDGIDRAVERASAARSAAGARASRLARESDATEETTIQQQSLLSLLRDVDVAEAATRLSTLSTQLEAGLIALSRAGSLSLIRFLA